MAEVVELPISEQQGRLYESKSEFLLIGIDKERVENKPKPPNLPTNFTIVTKLYCNGKYTLVKTERTVTPTLMYQLRLATGEEQQEWQNIK